MKDFPLDNSLLNQEKYEQMYAESFANKEQFWSKIAKEQVTWFKNFSKVKNTNYEGDVSIKWFEDGELKLEFESQLFAGQSLPLHKQLRDSPHLLFPKSAQWLWHRIHKQML